MYLLLGAADAELVASNGDGVQPHHLHSYGGPRLCHIPSALAHRPHLHAAGCILKCVTRESLGNLKEMNMYASSSD